MLFKVIFSKKSEISKTVICIHNGLSFFFIRKSVHVSKAIDHKPKGKDYSTSTWLSILHAFYLKGKPLHLEALLEQLILRWPREYLTNGRLSLQLKKRGSQRRAEPKLNHVGFGKSPPHSSLQNDFASSGSPGLRLIFSHSAVTSQELPARVWPVLGNRGHSKAQGSKRKQDKANKLPQLFLLILEATFTVLLMLITFTKVPYWLELIN